MGETFMKKIEGESHSDNETDRSRTHDEQVDKIQIGFRLPFEPAACQDLPNKNYMIQTSVQEVKDGFKVYMTPGPTKKKIDESLIRSIQDPRKNKFMINQINEPR